MGEKRGETLFPLIGWLFICVNNGRKITKWKNAREDRGIEDEDEGKRKK